MPHLMVYTSGLSQDGSLEVGWDARLIVFGSRQGRSSTWRPSLCSW